MTDRVKYITVVLDADYWDDDAQEIIDAIKMVRGVQAADHSVINPNDYWARNSIRQEIWAAIYNATNTILDKR